MWWGSVYVVMLSIYGNTPIPYFPRGIKCRDAGLGVVIIRIPF